MEHKSTNSISIALLLSHLKSYRSQRLSSPSVLENELREEIRFLLLTEPAMPKKCLENSFVVKLLKPFRLMRSWFSKVLFHLSK